MSRASCPITYPFAERVQLLLVGLDDMRVLGHSAPLERTGPVAQVFEHLNEGPLLLKVGALDRGRVLNAPMRGRGVPSQTGQASPVALSQTVKMKSIWS